MSEEIEKALLPFGYESTHIRLIDLVVNGKATGTDPAGILASQMEAGSECRRRAGRGDALALLVARQIRKLREDSPEDGSGRAFILSSLKNPEELATLRAIYGPRLVVIGAHCPRRLRVGNLIRQFTDSGRSEEEARELAEDFVTRDADEGEPLGQNVSRTFHLADCFVEVGQHIERPELQDRVERIVSVLFGDPFRTPTREERGMFIAAGAAAQSGELTRQVGATVMRDDGSIISVGCNEVPRFGGGVYWEGDREDHREMHRSQDAASGARARLARAVAAHLEASSSPDPEADAGALLRKIEDELGGVTEFGRASHAEMTALFSAAANEASVVGATVLTTTFPCHTCTRYMLTAGIRRVIYVSPYERSQAADLYPEAIDIDPGTRGGDPSRMVVEPFLGVAPRRYLEWFGMDWRESSASHQKRADDQGYVVPFDPSAARPLSVDAFGFSPDSPLERDYLEREAHAAALAGDFADEN